MLKKTKVAWMVMLLLSTSSWGKGFYAGLGAGIDTAEFAQHSNVVSITPHPESSFFVTNKARLSGTGYLGSIFGGYGWNRNQLYLGGEVNANVSSVKSKQSNAETIHQSFSKTTLRVNRSYGVSILPGYLFPDNTTLFYARLGFERGGFEINTSDVSLSSVNKILSGFRYGAGMEKTFGQHFAIRLDYSHVDYQTYGEATLDPGSFVRKVTGFTPRSNQFDLGLIYKI